MSGKNVISMPGVNQSVTRHYQQFGNPAMMRLAMEEADMPVDEGLWSWSDFNEWFPDMAAIIWNECVRLNFQIPLEFGYVYLIQARGTNYYKIGKAIKPGKRLSQISPKMPFECDLMETRFSYFPWHAEQMMHKWLDGVRANGEWFQLENAKDSFNGIPAEVIEFAYPYELSDKLCGTYGYKFSDGEFLPFRIGPMECDSGFTGLGQLDPMFRQIKRIVESRRAGKA